MPPDREDHTEQSDQTRFADWTPETLEFDEPEPMPHEKRDPRRFNDWGEDTVEFARRTHIHDEE